MRFAVLLILGLLVVPRLAAAADSSMVTITQSGAACDGRTDDSAAINRWLSGLKGGGLVAVPPGKTCLIAGANLVVPNHARIVIMRGSSGPGTLSGHAGDWLTRADSCWALVARLKCVAALRWIIC